MASSHPQLELQSWLGVVVVAVEDVVIVVVRCESHCHGRRRDDDRDVLLPNR